MQHKLDRHEIYMKMAWILQQTLRQQTLDNARYANMTYILVLIVHKCGSGVCDHVTRCMEAWSAVAVGCCSPMPLLVIT